MTAKDKNISNSFDLAKNSRTVPSEAARLKIVIQSTIHDRFWGLSTSEQIWGEAPNKRMIEEDLADALVRRQVAEFFVSRALAPILVEMIGVRMVRPAETIFTKSDVVSAVSKRLESGEASRVVLEFLIPAMIKIGMVSSNIDYASQVSYGFDRVTVESIRKNVTTYNVIEAYNGIKLNIDPKMQLSTAVFAETLAEAMRPIGIAMFEMVDLSGVVDDIVRGVRAYLDPTYNARGVQGSVPNSWRSHTVVAELATNLVFVREALSMPENSSLSLQTDEWKLSQWAPVVLAAIKSSERYSIVSKSQALQNYELRKVRDIRDVPVSTVVVRNLVTQPVAQSVFALKDAVVSHAYNINATRDRIAEVIQMAYGKADFSTVDGAQIVVDNLRDYVDQGWTGQKAVYMIDVTESAESITDLAIFLSEHVYVEFVDGKISVSPSTQRILEANDELEEALPVSQLWDPQWYFYVPTKEKGYRPWSGQHLGSVVVTSDTAEVFLAADELDSSTPVPVRPQLLSSVAFGSRLVGTNIKDMLVMSPGARYVFNVNAAGLEINGALKASDFASLRSGSNTCLVKPHFNSEVVKGLQGAYSLANSITTAAKRKTNWSEQGRATDETFALVENRAARMLLQQAQQLSPAFRQEVHEMMVEKALIQNRKTGSEADLFRSRLVQKTFGAVADLVALSFFLYLQGIDCEVWNEMIKSSVVQRTCGEFGTDRDLTF